MSDQLLRVMLVDDEENERNLLRICIKWNEIGMEIAGEASSAREALDSLEEINPDIIITDIRMPFMDGLEFSKIVVETYPYIKVMVLTAHEEFEYAKEGIKVGIADFLLKPIKRTEIKNALVNLKNKIESERLYKNEFNELKKQLEDNFPYIKEKFLNELLQNSLLAEDLENKMDYFSLNDFKSYVQVALIEYENVDKEVFEEQKVLLGMKCTEIIKKYFKEDKRIEVFADNGRRIVVLNGDDSIELVECCEQIKAMVINRLKCYVSIGIGNVYRDIKDLKRSYGEACEALNYKALYGKNNVISFADTNINENNWSTKTDEISKIGFFVKTGIGERAIEQVHLIFEEFYRTGLKSIDQIRITSINIVTVMLNAITELGIDYNDIFASGSLPYDSILKIDTVPDMDNYITGITTDIVNSVKSIRTRKTNKVISEIINSMQENLANSGISLSNVAKDFYLNSSYLSRIFKQETGCTFVEYLTKIRIEKALSFFKETELMLYEVAEQVGIPDPNYFGKCFKKHMGMSVNDYKKQSQI